MFPLGYYKLTKPLPKEGDDEDYDLGLRVGQLFYLTEVSGEQAHVIRGESSWNIDLPAFEDCFQFDPEGFAKRQDRIAELMEGLNQIGARQDRLLLETSAVPCIAGPGEEEQAEPEPVAPLEPTGLIKPQASDPVKFAHNLKIVKTQLAYTQKLINRRQKELSFWLKEQKMILAEKVQALTKHVEMASEAIYMLNVYMGKDEEFVRIRNGKRAPEDTKVAIRQLILYMDEETAAAEDWAKDGGMDFKNVKEFDEWLCKPENLQQVLPEEKGIIAFRPRREEKEYSDTPLGERRTE
jgi:hypothetical protein